MDRTEIENHILHHYYICREKGIKSPINILVDKIPGANKSLFENVMEKMEKKGLLQDLQPGYYAEIAGLGINEAETLGLIPKERVDLNYLVRFQILDFAAKVEDDLESDSWAEISELKLDVAAGHSGLDFNFLFLKELNLITGDSGRYYRITGSGTRNLEKWRGQFRFQTEYDRISKLAPQARGREFEKLVTEIIKFAGWEAEHDVQTSFEQMDVVIHKEREFYLIECKWEKKPIESGVVNELFGKLSKRTLTNGILFSMSGFSSGVDKNVESLTGKKAILLFGEKDIKKLILNPSSFEDLLNEKFTVLISQRKVVFN
jgi:hypothetical protein